MESPLSYDRADTFISPDAGCRIGGGQELKPEELLGKNADLGQKALGTVGTSTSAEMGPKFQGSL